MFSLMCVYVSSFLFTGVRGIGHHVTITHDALNLTVQLPPPEHGASLDRDSAPLIVASGGHYWRPIQMCLLWDNPCPHQC